MHREEHTLDVGAQQEPDEPIFSDLLRESIDLLGDDFELEFFLALNLSHNWRINHLDQCTRIVSILCWELDNQGSSARLRVRK